jgi:23S rRNA (uracil1939-C5)-methyltransferase
MQRTLRIEGIAPAGDGVAHDGARTVFVPFTAPGDVVDADVPGGTGPAHARLVRVLEAGPDRVEPPCGHFGECGGCEWLHLRYEAQLAAKERAFHETLRRLARLEPGGYASAPIAPSPEAVRYRSRAKLHFDRASGRLAFFRRRSHDPVRLDECWLLSAGLDALREALGAALAATRLEPAEVTLEWSERQGAGAAALKVGAITAAVQERARALLQRLPELRGVVLQAEGAPAAVVGDPVLLHDRVPGDPAAGAQRSRPDVFQQANRGANARLVALAVALLEPAGASVLELYCGSGNFTAAAAARAREVHAVEVQGPALELARADAGDAAGVRFYAGDSLAVARAFARERGGPGRFDAVLLDPPREGAKGIAVVLRDLAVERAVYVSCDPATLARDVGACAAAGYRVASAQAVDMFPQTHHVEGVVLLRRAAPT